MHNPFNLLKRDAATAGHRAVVDETVLAESSETIRLEGNHYFPPASVTWDHLERSSVTSVCFWKGSATYYDVVVDGRRIPAAAWTYEKPSAAADHIRNHVAFWHGVKVVRSDPEELPPSSS